MKIVWSSDAIEMADYFFEVTRHLYGHTGPGTLCAFLPKELKMK